MPEASQTDAALAPAWVKTFGQAPLPARAPSAGPARPAREPVRLSTTRADDLAWNGYLVHTPYLGDQIGAWAWGENVG